MKIRNQIILFGVIALVCLTAIFILKVPYRNYAPIVWGLFGFGLNGFLYIKDARQINKRLIADYGNLLDSLNISIYNMLGWPRIDTYALLYNKQLASSLDEEMRDKLKGLRLKMKLTTIAFFLYAIFGILTVILASKNL